MSFVHGINFHVKHQVSCDFLMPYQNRWLLIKISNAITTSCISLLIALIQHFLLLLASSLVACSTPEVVSMSYLWVAFRDLEVTIGIITYFFISTHGTHPQKSDSDSMHIVLSNSSTSTGLDSFKSFNVIYSILASMLV